MAEHQADQAQVVNLKIEQAKLPKFFGQQEKDTVTALYLINRINDLSAANNWSPEVAYSHFAMSVEGSASEWLTSQMDIATSQKTWTWIEPRFRLEFMTDDNDCLLLDQLKKTEMRTNEKLRDYFSRINKLIRVLESTNTTSIALTPPANGETYTPDEVRRLLGKQRRQVYDHTQLKIFNAGLPQEIKSVVIQHKPEDPDRAYSIARDQYQLIERKKLLAIDTPTEETPDIEPIQPSFRPQVQPFKPNNFQQNYRTSAFNMRPFGNKTNTFNRQSRPNNGYQNQPKNNLRKNGVICVFCHFNGHHQEDCRRRIQQDKPCIATDGKPYWPKPRVQALENDVSTVQSSYMTADFQ